MPSSNSLTILVVNLIFCIFIDDTIQNIKPTSHRVVIFDFLSRNGNWASELFFQMIMIMHENNIHLKLKRGHSVKKSVCRNRKSDSSRKNGDGGVWDTDHNPKLRVPVGYTNVYNNR